MKDEHATLKGLNINTLKVQPLPEAGGLSGLQFLFHFFSTGFTGGYSNFIPSG
jgi:hypothetical protein